MIHDVENPCISKKQWNRLETNWNTTQTTHVVCGGRGGDMTPKGKGNGAETGKRDCPCRKSRRTYQYPGAQSIFLSAQSAGCTAKCLAHLSMIWFPQTTIPCELFNTAKVRELQAIHKPIIILPAVGSYIRKSSLEMVDFPAPLSLREMHHKHKPSTSR